MTGFDTVIVVDWSARSAPSPKWPVADAIWIGVARGGPAECHYSRTRSQAMAFLTDLLKAERAAGHRVLAGFDFPFGYPEGFAQAVCGTPKALDLWKALAQRIEDRDDNSNNRFKVAHDLNGLFPGIGPFWGCPAAQSCEALPAKGTKRHGHGLPERRAVEHLIRNAQPCWKLYTTGSVGSQALLGIPRLQSLRQTFGSDLAVSPFQPTSAPIVLAEVFPSLLAPAIAARQGAEEIKDRAQVRITAEALQALPPERLTAMLQDGDAEEGWILGAGHQKELIQACP